MNEKASRHQGIEALSERQEENREWTLIDANKK